MKIYKTKLADLERGRRRTQRISSCISRLNEKAREQSKNIQELLDEKEKCAEQPS